MAIKLLGFYSLVAITTFGRCCGCCRVQIVAIECLGVKRHIGGFPKEAMTCLACCVEEVGDSQAQKWHLAMVCETVSRNNAILKSEEQRSLWARLDMGWKSPSKRRGDYLLNHNGQIWCMQGKILPEAQTYCPGLCTASATTSTSAGSRGSGCTESIGY